MDELIATTGLAPSRDVDFLVINCSLFCPTPSLCASVARKYKLKSTVRTYSLHGMGCSASLISEPRLGAHRSKPSFIFVPVRGPRRHRPGKAAPPEPRKLDCGWVTVRRNNVVRPGTLPLPRPRAVVISLEEISSALYMGNTRSMLLQNTLFRTGGAGGRGRGARCRVARRL